MFLTNSYTPQGQQARNIHYVTPGELGTPPVSTTDADYCREVAASLTRGALFCLLR
jgi:hypothetical protein